MAQGSRQAQLNNLMHRFLGVPLIDTIDPDNIFRILRNHIGASSPRDILRLSREDLDDFTLTDSAGNNPKLTFIQKLRIVDLGRWASEHDTAVDWATADPDDFEEWVDNNISPRASNAPGPFDPAAIAAAVAGAIPSAAEVGEAIENARSHTSPSENFLKGTRRSIDDYKIYKDKRQWNSWNRSLRATGRQHGLDHVFDPLYVPPPLDIQAIDLFQEQQKFLFAVFTATLKESSALEILRQHSDPTQTSFGNAQGIYASLSASMQGGVQAKIAADSIESELGTMRLDTTWTKSCESFVNRMATLLSDHQNVVDQALYDDQWYIRKLETSLGHNGEFRQFFTSAKVQRQQLMRLTAGIPGALLPAESYADVLAACLDQAKTIDQATKARAPARIVQQAGRGIPNVIPAGRGRGSGRGQGRGRGRTGRGRTAPTPRHDDWLASLLMSFLA